MVSAILMAGYKNKREVKKYSKTVAEHYGEKFIETGYRPKENKPLIQYTLEKLFASDHIDEVVIVGHRMLLEQRLGNFIKGFQKPCCIINQNSKIPLDIIKRFNIINRKVKYNTIAGNLIKGYAASTASKHKKHALFVASDSPLTTIEFIERFLQTVQKDADPMAIAFPAILINIRKDKLERPPLKLLNDTE
jgi:spore coat polysaccharide biosynthesis protein SpsF (cytidylyltransferase family)